MFAIASASSPILFCVSPLKKLVGAFWHDILALMLIIPGLGLGIAALALRRGRKGVLAPALFGVISCSLLLLIFVTNYRAARARIEAKKPAPPPSEQADGQR